jgi:hypothetical protein
MVRRMTVTTTMAERNVASAEAYYRAMSGKDLAGVARHLHPDVRFVGPLAELVRKEAVVEAATGFAALIKSLRIRAKFGSEDRVMLAYDCRAVSADILIVLSGLSPSGQDHGLLCVIEVDHG